MLSEKTEDLIIKLMRPIRRWVYKLGLRPKLGSVLYSPTLALKYSWLDALKKDCKNCGHKYDVHLFGYCKHCPCDTWDRD